MPAETRAQNQERFLREEGIIVVATVAFGMGIDKSNVRFVIHRDMPKSVEAWYQEVGRAGRDGLASDCVIFYSWADVIGYEAFLDGIEDPALRTETKRKTVEMFIAKVESIQVEQSVMRRLLMLRKHFVTAADAMRSASTGASTAKPA